MRLRAGLSIALLVIASVALPTVVVSTWSHSTIYDSGEFSKRMASVLDSGAVRHQLATRLTQELARAGNQQAVNFRPAFELAVEAAVDTDTFRSIFRTAIQRTHQSLLAGEGATGLNLSDSIAIISTTLQLPENAGPGTKQGGGLNSTLTDITRTLNDYHFLQWRDGTKTLAIVGSLVLLIAVVGAVALAADRRRTVHRLGWIVVIDGIAIALIVPTVAWIVGRAISDPQLSGAVRAAIRIAMGDLRTWGLWIAGYGVIIVAASSTSAHAYTASHIRAATAAFIERRRRSTWGTIALGALAIAASLALVMSPQFWLESAIFVIALWLAYLGVIELLAVIRTRLAAPEHVEQERRWARIAAVGAAVVLLTGIVSAGLILSTNRAADRATASGERKCNGDVDFCDLPLDEAVFPGSHNSMSSALYPGWLFAEQIETIGGQLDAGVRALLFDTHYGIPSSATMPGSNTPLVLTDRAAELAHPPGEDIDPAVEQRADQLAARAPAKANAKRQIYLCHNFCEMGAVAFSSVLAEIKQFVDTHPDDVVVLIIQDATTPADTAAAITKAGLADSTYTLQAGKSLPTLGDLIDAKQTLIVFAEQGGTGAPSWYQKAYDWFQETPFVFTKEADFNCQPNRGQPENPLFLVNHWIEASPPSPSKAAAVNAPPVLDARLAECASERGHVPNVVAVDFAVRGDIASRLRQLPSTLLEQSRSGVDLSPTASISESTTTTQPTTTTIAPAATTTTTTTTGTPTSSMPLTIPSASEVDTLTAGDPVPFCAAVTTAGPVVEAWAFAASSETAGDQGRADLVYGPALAQVLTAYGQTAPEELYDLALPLISRATSAVDALTALGINEKTQRELAAVVIEGVSQPDSPGALSVQATVEQQLESTVDSGALATAAEAFVATNGDATSAMDLGDVPSDVATASGFGCLTTIS